MRALLLERIGAPLVLKEDVPKPVITEQELLVKVEACGVCRTDLHIFDGELTGASLPLILGHQVVGKVVETSTSSRFKKGDYVGIPWLGGCCFSCPYCLSGRENLCDKPTFTGFSVNGGFAEYCKADEAFVLPIPPRYDPLHAAPLLCAGLIGYRALMKTGDAEAVGFYGFGSSAHLTLQTARAFSKRVFVFTKPGDIAGQSFARALGAVWAGGSDEEPPEQLDAALIFAPVGELMVEALRHIKKGGPVISAGIHMSSIPEFPYSLLWGERSLTSVANLTRQDGLEFMALAAKIPFHVTVTPFPFPQANEALAAIRSGEATGSVVLYGGL